MGWPTFKKAFDNLYIRYLLREAGTLDSLPYYRRHTLRFLDSLGHCDVEFNESGGRIYSASPLLVRLPTYGFPQSILCGSRTPKSLDLLTKACSAISGQIKVDVQAQASTRAYVSRRVIVQAESVDALRNVAESLHISFSDNPPAWALLQLSGSVDDCIRSCEWSIRPELNWPSQDYDLERLQFISRHEPANAIRLSSYDDITRGRKVHFLWQGESCAQIDRDWGRYIALNRASYSVLIYDPRRSLLAAPSGAPLPRLIARALTLCSGLVARFVDKVSVPIRTAEQIGFDVYTDIAPDIAQLAAAKLGQPLIESSLNIFKEKTR
jgi:hypothetical protein